MKNMRKVLIFLSVLLFTSCEKEIDKYYERPDFLKGNAYEALVERGNFTIFLKAAERSGFASVLNGRGLVTVLAPTDDAFQGWLSKKGYPSIDDAPLAELEQLVPYHIIENAYEKEYMLGFVQSPDYYGKGGGLEYKFKTLATPINTTEIDPLTGESYRIAHLRKYIPVISTRMFKTKKCTDYEKNYKFFFPDVNWLGDEEQLYAGNAAVIEAGIPTDNGYLNILDQVAEPLPTIYKALKAETRHDYSAFIELYDKFTDIKIRKTDDSLYYYKHRNLSQLNCEHVYQGQYEGSAPDFYRYMRETYNCFVPTTGAIESFFNEYFEGYNSYNDIPQMTLDFMLNPYARGGDLLLPEVMDNDGVSGSFGDEWTINSADLLNPLFCTNGVLYGMNRVFKPMLFDIITKPLFNSPEYTITANIFFKGSIFVTLADPTPDRFTLLIQHDSILMNQYGYTFDNGSSHLGDEKIEIEGEEMKVGAMTARAEAHIINGGIRDFTKRKFYSLRKPFSFVYTNDGALYAESGEELMIEKTWETLNGPTYAIDREVSLGSTTMARLVSTIDLYSEFFELLKLSEMIGYDEDDNTKLIFTNITGDRCILFIPENGSFNYDELKLLPKEELVKILNFCFVSINANSMSDYVIPNYTLNNVTMPTLQESDLSTPFKTIFNEIEAVPSGDTLKLVNEDGREFTTDGGIPLFASDGLIYLTEGLISSGSN